MAIERQFSGTRPARPAPWRDPRVRAIVYQALTVIVVVLLVAYFVDNTLTNLRRQGIATGFGFLDRTAGLRHRLLADRLQRGVDLRPGLPGRPPQHAAGRGARRSSWRPSSASSSASRGCRPTGWSPGWPSVYVETVRNIPLLLQLLFWYFAVLQALPQPRDSVAFGEPVFLNNRGLYHAAAGARARASARSLIALAGRARWRSSCWRAGPGAGARRPASRSTPCWSSLGLLLGAAAR